MEGRRTGDGGRMKIEGIVSGFGGWKIKMKEER